VAACGDLSLSINHARLLALAAVHIVDLYPPKAVPYVSILPRALYTSYSRPTPTIVFRNSFEKLYSGIQHCLQ